MQVESIPADLADIWGITEASAQVILSIVVIFAVLLPVMYLSKGRNTVLLLLIVTFLSECLLVGLGWLPFWILIATVALMALGVATIGTSIIFGDSGGD